MQFAFRFSAAAAACLSFCAAHAEGDVLEETVVTATRIEQPVSQAIGSVTVITREEIEHHQVQSVQDLLRGEAGIQVANNGGLGKFSSIYLRGANAAHTLILVDGVRLGSDTAGTTSIELIPVDQIERIEIVRGPRSSLYGSDAIGGVIQIFTRKNQGVSLSGGLGTHDTRLLNGAFGMESGALRFNASAGYIGTEGFNACSGDPINFAGCFVNEPDRDGYRNTSTSVRAGYRTEKLDVEFSTLYAHGYNEYDGYSTDFGISPNQTRFTQSAPALKLKLNPISNLSITLTGGVTQDRRDEFGEGIFTGTFDTEKRSATVQSDWRAMDAQTITVGADYLDDVIDSTTPYDRNSRTDTGVFAQYLARIRAHELAASIRDDHNQQFGTHATGNAGWKWFVLDQRLTLNAGWGSAFHAPTFNDLYYPGFSNPFLKPETSQSFELGASGNVQTFDWSLQGFVTRAENLIGYDVANNYMPGNIGAARMRGVEFTLRHQWRDLSTAINYAALDARSREAGANYNHYLARRARRSGRIDVRYSHARLQLGGAVNLVGERYDDLANTARLGGYATVDVTADVRLGQGWSLQAKLANALDRQYETARYFNQDGRSIFVSVRYQTR